MELREAAFHHVFDPKLFHAQEVQDHGVRQAELRLQLRWLALEINKSSETL